MIKNGVWRLVFLGIWLFGVLIVGCTRTADPPLVTPTVATRFPTPTLAPGAPTLPPTTITNTAVLVITPSPTATPTPL
ncbi:MAG: hypothetical protein D6706_22020, partial [Chloroflexi bacterium]